MKDESQPSLKEDDKGAQDAAKKRKPSGLKLSEGLNKYLTKEKKEKLEEII